MDYEKEYSEEEKSLNQSESREERAKSVVSEKKERKSDRSPKSSSKRRKTRKDTNFNAKESDVSTSSTREKETSSTPEATDSSRTCRVRKGKVCMDWHPSGNTFSEFRSSMIGCVKSLSLYTDEELEAMETKKEGKKPKVKKEASMTVLIPDFLLKNAGMIYYRP